MTRPPTVAGLAITPARAALLTAAGQGHLHRRFSTWYHDRSAVTVRMRPLIRAGLVEVQAGLPWDTAVLTHLGETALDSLTTTGQETP